MAKLTYRRITFFQQVFNEIGKHDFPKVYFLDDLTWNDSMMQKLESRTLGLRLNPSINLVYFRLC